MKNLFFVLIVVFGFTACSSKNNINKQTPSTLEKKVETKTSKETSDDEFNEDFGDDFDGGYAKVEEVFDPLSGYNRIMTTFNDKVFIYALNPTAKGYAYVLPKTVRSGISNFFDNLMFPLRFVNNVLQFKFQNSAEELGRFLINTTFGLAGFMDPAKTEFGWEQHDEDFGQTLGFYGVGEGFHVVLPFLGPSNLRDMVGLVADSYTSPLSNTGSSDLRYKIPDTQTQSLAIRATSVVNGTSLRLGLYESLKKDAFDLYPYFRDLYNQRRNTLIKE
ncbi:MAG: ABC transporter [Arcobacter sp.]|nr:ABC transporter [Arcobacter sp.]